METNDEILDINEALEEEAVEEVHDEVVEEPQLSKHEQEAQKFGWTTKEVFVDKGGDPDNWKPAKAYIDYRKLQESSNEKYRKLEHKFEAELQDIKKVHSLQLMETIEKLTTQRKEAIEIGDVEAVDQIEKKLNDAREAVPAQSNTIHPLIDEWNRANPWSADPANEKTIIANAFYKAAVQMNPNMSIAERLQFVDENLEIKYPTKNLRRSMPASTDTAQRSAPKANPTWNDLTNSEKQQYEKFGDMFKSKDAFIKAAIKGRTK